MRRRGHALALHRATEPGCFEATLPPSAAGQWCRLSVSVGHGAAWWVKLEAADAARGQVVREAFLGAARRSSGRTWRTTLVHLPIAAGRLSLRVFTATQEPAGEPVAVLDVLGRNSAALTLLANGWPVLPRGLAGGLRGLAGRLRTMLGQHPARSGEAPPYRVWTALYDDWAPQRRALGGQQPVPIDIVVVGDDAAKQAATLASLHAQWLAPARIDAIAEPACWAASGHEWVLVMQAGEILQPHALACFAAETRRHTEAQGIYADVDSIVGDERADPLFKPQADPWLLRSGLLTRGACLFRAGLLSGGHAPDAAHWRLQAALASPALRRIPFVLTHVPGSQDRPARNAPVPSGRTPHVTIVIPTSARHAHTLACLRAVLALTDYPEMDILLAVSAVDRQDRAQSAHLDAAAALPGVRVLDLRMAAFNYAAVNNAAVGHARGELVLLLNDDVVPLQAAWLRCMVACVAGAFPVQADVVGARLLYGNGLVQHGGVTMGLANLCEHSFRLAEPGQPGPHGLARLNRQVSAVTAACMLVRRTVFESLCGMDESFAIALNDADFCLRAGREGACVLFAAEVTLLHHESLSLGRHYEGERACLEAIEVRRLADTWAAVIADDPFYSPAASLQPGREFQPGFPPRITPESWLRDAMPDHPPTA